MRQFLYITPYFAPQTQVGALRPLKFARHLEHFGWQPVILCDLWPGDQMDIGLEAAVPASVPILRDYSHRAQETYQKLHAATRPDDRPGRTTNRIGDKLPKWMNNPELLPLGEHSPDMPWAWRAAHRALRQFPKIEAILVNADPFAASVVGAWLSRETGLPLIQDFRDIWAPCNLRRPRRPPPWLWLEDKLERFCFEHAAHIVINTATSLRDYLKFYADLPAERFSVIRNHFDADLVSHGQHAGFDRYTLLHLGNFSRFRVADPLVRAVAEVVRRGIPKEALQVVSTGAFGADALALAAELGVAELFRTEPSLPYHEIGAILQACDLTVMIAEPDADQRIASKFYDYLGCGRPMLAISDNPESSDILRSCGAGAQFGHRDVAGMADFIQREVQLGRQRAVARPLDGLTSRDASAKLARLLDDVTAKGAGT